MIRLEIPGLPKSMNNILRMHRMEAYKYFRDCQDEIVLIAKRDKVIPKEPFEKAEIKIMFVFPDKIKRDFDNMFGGCKGYIDGIKKAGIIVDDNWKRISYDFDGKIGEAPKTIIIIKEAEN
jgi:Holliday junction resolvase RusA-like endonuclease